MTHHPGRFRDVPHSGFPGITWQSKKGKWRLSIYHQGVRFDLGVFKTVAVARFVLKMFRDRYGYLSGLDLPEVHQIVKRFRKELRDDR